MAKLPDTLGPRDIPTPQRNVRGYDTGAMARGARAMARATEDAGQNLEEAGRLRQESQDKDAILDAQRRENNVRRQMIDFLYGTDEADGLYNARGEAALGASKKFADRYKEIRSSAMQGVANPVAMRALEKSLADIELSHLDNIKRFEAGERRSYAGELASTRAQLADDRVGLEWNNDKTFAEEMANKEKSVRAAEKIKGTSGEGIELAVRQATAGLHQRRYLSMLNSDDPAVWAQAFNAYERDREAGHLTAEVVDKMDSMFDAVRPQIDARKELDNFRGGKLDLSATPKDKVFRAMLAMESSEQHYDPASPDGLTTSPKGAKGIAQLMPDTAREMAKELGLKGDAWRDPGMNQIIGEAYFNKMLEQFNDPALAIMAYNAGPGALADFMNGTNYSGKNGDKKGKNGRLKIGDPRTGEVTMDYFIAQFPFRETRQYVAKVMAASGGGTGPLDVNEANAYAARLDPKVQPEFLKLVERQNRSVQAQRETIIKSTMDESLAYMQQNGVGWESLPALMRAQAAEAGIATGLQSYDGTTKPELAAYLYGLSPAELKDTDLNTPGIRLGLSAQDYEKWTAKQQRLDSAATRMTEEARNTQVSNAFLKRGISTRSNKGKEQMVRFNELLDFNIDAFVQMNNGRYPNGAEIQKMVDDLFIKPDLNGRWFGGSKYAFNVTLESIDKKTQEKIRAKLLSEGTAPTEAAIIEKYILGER